MEPRALLGAHELANRSRELSDSRIMLIKVNINRMLSSSSVLALALTGSCIDLENEELTPDLRQLIHPRSWLQRQS